MNKEITSQEADLEIIFQSGVAKREAKQYIESIADFSKTLSINPKHVAANYQMVYSLTSLERYDEALFYANKIVELAPSQSTYYQRAYVKESLNDLEGAAADTEMGNSIPKDDCWC